MAVYKLPDPVGEILQFLHRQPHGAQSVFRRFVAHPFRGHQALLPEIQAQHGAAQNERCGAG